MKQQQTVTYIDVVVQVVENLCNLCNLWFKKLIFDIDIEIDMDIAIDFHHNSQLLYPQTCHSVGIS
jgi:hypothetical protein